MTRIDITPDPNIFEAIRADRYNLIDCNQELLDNSLDWGATIVRISISREEIRVTDNGRGCADLSRMFTLGTHNPDGRRIGRYGVGFNTAAVWLGLAVSVESVSAGMRRRLQLRWPDVQLSGWVLSGPDPQETSDPSGVDIRITELIPRRLFVGDLIAKFSARYPFLEASGKAIFVNGSKLVGSPLPAMAHQIVVHGEWEGRAYRLTAGVVNPIPSPWKAGFAVMLRDRVMADGLSDGCGEYSKQGFLALVELLEGVEMEDGSIGGPWPVEKTKNGITDGIRIFMESLLPDVEPLLKIAESEASTMVLRGLETQLSGNWLEEALFEDEVREKRPGDGGATGTATPAGTGGRRTRATNIDPNAKGSVRLARGIGRAVRVRFSTLGEEDIACVDHNSARTECVLNEAHPFVKANRDLGLLQTKMLVAQMVLTHWLDESSPVRSRIVNQLQLPLDGPRFEEMQRAMARILRRMDEPGGA